VPEETQVFLSQVQSLQAMRQGESIHTGFRDLQNLFSPDGAQGRNSRRSQGELVTMGENNNTTKGLKRNAD